VQQLQLGLLLPLGRPCMDRRARVHTQSGHRRRTHTRSCIGALAHTRARLSHTQGMLQPRAHGPPRACRWCVHARNDARTHAHAQKVYASTHARSCTGACAHTHALVSGLLSHTQRVLKPRTRPSKGEQGVVCTHTHSCAGGALTRARTQEMHNTHARTRARPQDLCARTREALAHTLVHRRCKTHTLAHAHRSCTYVRGRSRGV